MLYYDVIRRASCRLDIFFQKNRGKLRYVLRVTPEFLLTRKTHLFVIKSLQTFFIKSFVDTEFGRRKFGQFLWEKNSYFQFIFCFVYFAIYRANHFTFWRIFCRTEVRNLSATESRSSGHPHGHYFCLHDHRINSPNMTQVNFRVETPVYIPC